MKELICKNCGAAYPEDTEYCPYCGTMNKKGAY
ncbi:MAG: zinc-ribbon domain-containing protein, partial [Erysipelotrichaceae bacterium]|nr:zinc-ribbon domain-containing protein [Erysipelotrichaceae bacterium]